VGVPKSFSIRTGLPLAFLAKYTFKTALVGLMDDRPTNLPIYQFTNPPMLSEAERINILKSVNIFFETPDEDLVDVAPLLDEVVVMAGETIFEKGDLGSSMFIIVEGRVQVKDEERTLNYLGKRDVFGEMAALDPEPRSASVIASEDSLLFRLSQEGLYELMARRSGVTRGIVRILCQRLRARTHEMAEDYKYMLQFAKVTSAAVAVENGIYEPESLDEVAERTDALGQLARVFQRMVREVYTREKQLKQQVEELRIEIDEVKKARQVAEVTETDYFQQLRKRARDLRAGRNQETD
jgi:CRP-like cAMP-binding protein